MDLEPGTVGAIARHAALDYPREACGLVAVIRGRQRYLPCRNTAIGTEHFRIAPEDYARVEDIGEIIAVAHSHPDAPAAPSEHDRVVCEQSRLPWFIVSARKLEDEGETFDLTDWARLDPSGYEAPLVGRPFSHGVLDCYSLIRDWYRRERGIELADFERRDDWWEKGEDLYRQQFAAAGFRALKEGEGPQTGDVFLAQIRSPVPNHGGVYVGDGLVLHHLHGRLSSRDVWGGYLAENCTHWLRYVGPAGEPAAGTHGPGQEAAGAAISEPVVS